MGWLYVPAGEGWNLGSPSPLAERIAPSVTSNGKFLLAPGWSRKWKKGGYIRLLSGTTLLPSTADAGVDAWISSLRDSPASPSAQPGSATPTPTTGTSGRMSGGLSSGRRRLSSFWRTSQPLFQLDNGTGDRPTWWSETSWSDWVTALRRRSSRHRMLAHRTSGNGSLSWATPTGHPRTHTPRDVDHGMQLANQVDVWASPRTSDTNGPGPHGDGGTDLRTQAHQWPTPATTDGASAGRHSTTTGVMHAGTSLTDATRQWPTPNVPNGGRVMAPEDIAAKGATANGKRQVGLEDMAKLWPTPAAIMPNEAETVDGWDARRAKVKAQSNAGNGMGEQLTIEARRFHLDPETPTLGPPSLPSAPNSHRLWDTPRVGPHGPPGQGARHGGQPKGMRLNPLFVEWLMGWPEGWSSVRSNTARSDSGFSATASSPPKPPPRS